MLFADFIKNSIYYEFVKSWYFLLGAHQGRWTLIIEGGRSKKKNRKLLTTKLAANTVT